MIPREAKEKFAVKLGSLDAILRVKALLAKQAELDKRQSQERLHMKEKLLLRLLQQGYETRKAR